MRFVRQSRFPTSQPRVWNSCAFVALGTNAGAVNNLTLITNPHAGFCLRPLGEGLDPRGETKARSALTPRRRQMPSFIHDTHRPSPSDNQDFTTTSTYSSPLWCWISEDLDVVGGYEDEDLQQARRQPMRWRKLAGQQQSRTLCDMAPLTGEASKNLSWATKIPCRRQ